MQKPRIWLNGKGDDIHWQSKVLGLVHIWPKEEIFKQKKQEVQGPQVVMFLTQAK